MNARLRPNRNCGCTLAEAFFLIAILALLKAHHAKTQPPRQ